MLLWLLLDYQVKIDPDHQKIDCGQMREYARADIRTHTHKHRTMHHGIRICYCLFCLILFDLLTFVVHHQNSRQSK